MLSAKAQTGNIFHLFSSAISAQDNYIILFFMVMFKPLKALNVGEGWSLTTFHQLDLWSIKECSVLLVTHHPAYDF